MRKFTSEEFRFDRLRTTLANSKIAGENNSLYQSILGLIDGGSFLRKSLEDKLGRNDKIILTNQVSGKLPPKNGGVNTGLYAPFVTLIANINGVGADDLYYYTSGDLVTVFGRFQVTPTAIGVNTEFAFELPIISYFKLPSQCAGAAYSPTVNQGAAILADVGNNRAKMQFKAADNSTFDLYFTFGYRVIEKT